MSGGHAGWFDQYYEPESLMEQLIETAWGMLPALYGRTADDLHPSLDGPDPELEAAHDLVDQLQRALSLSLLCELRRVSPAAAAPETVAALPVFQVEHAVERCRSLVIDGEPDRHYPRSRALYLDDMGTGWSTTVGVRELADWVAWERLADWVAPTASERRLKARPNREVSAVAAAGLLNGRRIMSVHVEQGDHPRIEYGYEQAEMCLDDGSLLVLDAKDSTWIGRDTELTATVDGDEFPDLPRALNRLVGRQVEAATAVEPPPSAAFAVSLQVGGTVLVLAAHGEGSSIEYSPPIVEPADWIPAPGGVGQ
jgi:hypothetical protein